MVEFEGLRALRHMTDGAIDADRLDYVHRDAFHTIGVKRSPELIIASLLYYDDEGPVFSNAGPVSDFLATRAILWSSVYLAPSNRFRVVLFSHILRDLRSQLREGRPIQFDGLSDKGLDFTQFREVDDLWMDRLILYVGANPEKLLATKKAEYAARALMGDGPSYDYFWLGGPKEPTEGNQVDLSFSVPHQLFFDLYPDYQSHTLYARHSIRVSVDHFRYLGGEASLEDCSGPFNAMLTERSSALPMPGRLLLFRPTGDGLAPTPVWVELDRHIADHSLFLRLKYEDQLATLDFEQDTRETDGYIGRPIFLSFAFEDVAVVRQIALELARLRRRYFCLLEPFTGLGRTARANSQKAVQDASAVLMVYSHVYASKFKNESQGNLASEVFEMIRRRATDTMFKIVPLSLESYRNIGSGFPWIELGFDQGQPPMVGPPLRNATANQIVSAVTEVVRTIEVR